MATERPRSECKESTRERENRKSKQKKRKTHLTHTRPSSWKVRTAFDICSIPKGGVVRQRDEEAIARRLTGSHNPNRFQPAGKSAPCSLTHCHHACGAMRTRGASVRVACAAILTVTLKARGSSAYLSNERRFRAALGLLGSASCFLRSRFCRHGWAERLAESRSVHQKKSRPGATRQNNHRPLCPLCRASRPGSAPRPRVRELGRFRFCQPKFRHRSERAEPAMYLQRS